MTTVLRLPEPNGIRARVGAEIRSRMARYNISQTALAQVMGMTQSQLSKRLRGSIPLDVDELETIAAALGTSVSSLFGGPDGGGNGPGPDGGSTVTEPLRLNQTCEFPSFLQDATVTPIVERSSGVGIAA